MRIFFTGGRGKARSYVATHLADQGYQVTNADLVPWGHPSVADLRVDLTDIGETYSAFGGLARAQELSWRRSRPMTRSCTFAAVPAILLTSGSGT